MKMPVASRIIFTILAIALPVGAHLADYNATHIFNPNWPPHAKFHTGQTLSFSIALALFTLFFAHRITSDKTLTVIASAAFAAIYFVTQMTAIFYPGTAFRDPDRINSPGQFIAGVPAQLIIDVVFLSLTGLAAWLALRKSAKWS
jgi:hypothetical protein